MQINDELKDKYCEEFGINKDIPTWYSETLSLKKANHYLAIPCGTGKTIGLAIAAVCDPELAFCYVASTHSRLREFVNTLDFMKVPYHYIHSSNETLPSSEEYTSICTSRIIIMTSSMLLQFPYSSVEFWMKSKTRFINRGLVIDELPKILLKIWYDNASWNFFSHYMIGTKFNKFLYWQLHHLFDNEDLVIDFDSALNESMPRSSDKQMKLLMARGYFSNLMRSLELPAPVDYAKDEHGVPDKTKFIYHERYLTIRQVYLNKCNYSTIILDATADLYSNLLGSEGGLEFEKDYKHYIEECFYIHFDSGFKQRDRILQDFMLIFKKYLPTIRTYEGPYYIVSHNSSLYDGMGEEKTANEEIEAQLKQIFKTVYINENKDFILCRESDEEVKTDDFGRVITLPTDIFISNFARSRGSNFFRDCRFVWILGTFYLPESELRAMIDQNEYDVSAKEVQKNLAIADAVQEISRGCIRKRNPKEKMTLFMCGDADVMEGVVDYMGIRDLSRRL